MEIPPYYPSNAAMHDNSQADFDRSRREAEVAFGREGTDFRKGHDHRRGDHGRGRHHSSEEPGRQPSKKPRK